MLAQSVVRQDGIDDAKPFSLDAIYASRGIEKVKRPGGADQACQQPPGAFFRRHAQTGEGGVHHGGPGSEADVAMKGEDEAPSERRAVDRGDRRLAGGDQFIPSAREEP